MTIRSKEDLLEVWSNMKKGSNIILWCDGLKKSISESKKGAISISSDSSEDEEEIQETVKRKRKRPRKQTKKGMVRQGRKEKKDEDKDKKKMQTRIDQLTAQHGDKTYTPMQYGMWAEMYLGGVHPGLDSAPTSTMFNRAGGDGGSVKRRMGHGKLSQQLVT